MKLGTLAIAAAAAVLTILSIGWAQDSPPIPDSLEKMLEQALKTNPDIALAEAAVREAQAELNQKRLKVAQQVATLHYDRKRLIGLVAGLKDDVDRVRKLAPQGVITEEQARKAILALADADAKLSQTEAEIQYVIGSLSKIRISFKRADWSPPAREPVKIEKSLPSRPKLNSADYPYLANRITVDWQALPIPEILKQLQAAADDELAFLLGPQMNPDDMADYPITLKLPKPVSIEVALEALGDFLRWDEFGFVITEYGVVLVSYGAAEDINGPSIPADVPLSRQRK